MNIKDIGQMILPKFIKPKIKTIWRIYKRKRVKLSSQKIKKEELIKGFRKLGIKEGQLLWIHSSLSSFGYVEGGVETIISALKEVVGKTGTIAMPTYSSPGGDKAYLQTNPIFDPNTTPSTVGKITDIFWRQPETKRSIHPTHSIAACGPLADELIEGHENASSEFGEGTPFYKMIQNNAYVLLLGVDIQYPIFYHTFEDIKKNFPYEVYDKEKIDARWLNDEGNIRIIQTKVHRPELGEFRIDSPKGISTRKIIKAKLEENRSIRIAKIGNATCMLFSVKSLMEVLDELLLKGISIYNIPEKHRKKFIKNR